LCVCVCVWARVRARVRVHERVCINCVYLILVFFECVGVATI